MRLQDGRGTPVAGAASAPSTTVLGKLVKPKRLSVVVPCYNEAEGLAELVSQLAKVCEACAGGDYELVLVNDGSADATWTEIDTIRTSETMY